MNGMRGVAARSPTRLLLWLFASYRYKTRLGPPSSNAMVTVAANSSGLLESIEVEKMSRKLGQLSPKFSRILNSCQCLYLPFQAFRCYLFGSFVPKL